MFNSLHSHSLLCCCRLIVRWFILIRDHLFQWRELERDATLRSQQPAGSWDGQEGSEEKIIEEIEYLKGEFDKLEGTS